MPARKPAGKYAKPSPDLTVLLLSVTAVASVAAAIVALPVGAVLLIGALVTAFAHPAPMLTGTKGTAANDYEERRQRVYASWIRARSGLLMLDSLAWKSLWPGIPVRVSALVSAGAGLLAGALPLSDRHVAPVLAWLDSSVNLPVPHAFATPWWLHVVSGALAAHVFSVLLSRPRLVDARPPVTLPSPKRLLGSFRLRALTLPLVVMLGAYAATVLLGSAFDLSGPAWWCAGVGGAMLASAAWLRHPADQLGLGSWRALNEARGEWAERFTTVFKEREGSPTLIERAELPGGIIVDTMDAPPGVYYEGMVKRAQDIEASFGGGVTVTVLPCPNIDSARQPVPGTRHATRVRVVTWPHGSHPNLLDANLDDELVALTHECDMADAMDAAGYNRPVLVAVIQAAVMPEKVALIKKSRKSEPVEVPVSEVPAPSAVTRAAGWLLSRPGIETVYPEDSPCAVWKSTWAFPDGNSYDGIRTEFEELVAKASRGSGGVDVVVDHRRGHIAIGDPLDEDVELTTSSEMDPQDLRNSMAELVWNKRWEMTLKQGVNPPTPRFEITRDAQLPMRFGAPLTLHEQLFATREGLDAGDVYIDPRQGLEKAMAASMSGAPFVSIVGFPKQNEPQGSRHTHLFLVRWADAAVPTRPQEIAPADGRLPMSSDGSAWVLAHQINQAFTARAVRLAKPEVAEAACLTRPDSPKHVWKARLTLYGATTLADIRRKADAIQAQLGCPWLRVREDESGGIWLYMGDPSGRVRFRNGADTEVANLDFEQAWIDSTVTSRTGRTPQLVSMAPLDTNPEVSVLDFEFPPGLDFQRVKQSKKSLGSNFKAEFLEIERLGASGLRMHLAKNDPLPTMAPVPWDDLTPGKLAFGVNAMGETVALDVLESPHLLVLGTSGAGKSVTMRMILASALLSDFDVVVVDPQKGGMDFAFSKPYSIAPFGETPYEGASILRALYGEVENRRSLLKKHGVPKIDELPEEVRPRRLLVVVDEFTSLLGTAPVPPKSDDPEAMHARDGVIAENNARITIGTTIGKLAREARFAGVHLVLGTQKLRADTLDKIPGGSDLKTNLARMSLGSMSMGDKMSAFRSPLDAEEIAEPKKGRGLYEGVENAYAKVFQGWYAPESEFAQRMAEAGLGAPSADRMLDPEDKRFKVAPPDEFVAVIEEDVVSEHSDVEIVDLDLDLGGLDLESIELDSFDDDDAPVADDAGPEPAADADGGSGPAVMHASSTAGPAPLDRLEELGQRLEDADQPAVIIWDLGGADEPTEVGASVRELLDDLAHEHGATVTITDDPEPEEPPAEEPIDSPAPTPQNEPDAPAVPAADSPVDDFDLGFTPPTIVRN